MTKRINRRSVETSSTSQIRAGVADESQPPQPTGDLTGSEGDAPMPTIENSMRYTFLPGRTCSILDVKEIIIAYILMLQGNDFNFAQGALRQLVLPEHAYAKMSEEAKKFLVPLPDDNILENTAGE